jgi:hypothetical protein
LDHRDHLTQAKRCNQEAAGLPDILAHACKLSIPGAAQLNIRKRMKKEQTTPTPHSTHLHTVLEKPSHAVCCEARCVWNCLMLTPQTCPLRSTEHNPTPISAHFGTLHIP